jgi:hypothetical protein
MRTFFLLIVAALFGFALGGLFLGYYQDYVLEYTLRFGVALLWGAIGVTLVFILGFSFLNRFAKRKLGVERYDAATIAHRLNTLLWDALNLNREAAQRTSEQLITEAVSFVSVFMFYRWTFGVFLAIVGTIGGTLGTIMPMPLAPESSTGYGFLDQHFHGERRACDELLDGAGSDAPDAVGLAALKRKANSSR